MILTRPDVEVGMPALLSLLELWTKKKQNKREFLAGTHKAAVPFQARSRERTWEPEAHTTQMRHFTPSIIF
jgi:hypothetical protein